MSDTGRETGLSAETGRLLRFGLVGLGATALHYAVAVALARGAALPVEVANAAAFCVAFLASFAGHYYWSFRSRRRVWNSLLGYLAVALGGLLLSTGMLVLAEAVTPWPEVATLALAVCVIPLFTFLTSRLFVF